MTGPFIKWIKLSGLKAAMLMAALSSIMMLPSEVGADRSLRCEGRIVSIGSTAREVTDACGKPDQVQQWQLGGNSHISQLFDYETERYLAPRLIRGPVHMERWTYDFGANRFIRYLDFQNGRLIRIQTGDKGKD